MYLHPHKGNPAVHFVLFCGSFIIAIALTTHSQLACREVLVVTRESECVLIRVNLISEQLLYEPFELLQVFPQPKANPKKRIKILVIFNMFPLKA